MSLFRKRNKRPEGPPDAALTFMTEDDATEFRTLVRTVFAEQGREVVVYADHVADDSGGQFGLWNIASLCSGRPRKEWRSLVDRHVRLITSPQPGLDELSDDELASGLVLRLVERQSLPNREWYPYARDLGADLVELLSVDLPESVATPTEADLAKRGPIDELRSRGLSNLRAVLRQPDIDVQRVSEDTGGGFTVVSGDSFFTASLSLLLPELLERVGVRDEGRGVLLVVPFRHQVAFRVVDGADSALALNHLFRWAMLGYSDAPGPLSPHVYWVRGGEWTQVTRFDEEDRPCVDVSEELAEALAIDE